MTVRGRSLLGMGAAALLVAVLLVLFTETGRSPADRPDRLAPASAPAEVRGCRERVEGGTIAPSRQRDTVIGPIGFYRLPTNYKSQASRPDLESFDALPVKAVALVRARARVTLVVPRRQRRWIKVTYDYPDHRGGHAITLQACRRSRSPRARRRECGWRPHTACQWRNTQFNGGFEIRFTQAPRRGRCAELIVRVKGKRKALREFLFDPEPRACKQGAG